MADVKNRVVIGIYELCHSFAVPAALDSDGRRIGVVRGVEGGCHSQAGAAEPALPARP